MNTEAQQLKPAEKATPVHPFVHVALLAFAAMFNPQIYQTSGPGIYHWFTTLLGAFVLSSIGYGLYYVVATERAKAQFPGMYLLSTWAALILLLLGSWAK